MATREQYRPVQDSYSRKGFAYDSGYTANQQAYQQQNQLAVYEPPAPPAAPMRAPQAPISHASQQAYIQNQAAFEDRPLPRQTRRPSTPDYDDRAHAHDPRRSRSEQPPLMEEKGLKDKVTTAGGPLAGAASGAMIGANLGDKKNKAGLGTVAGTIAGAFAGNQLEKKFKERRLQRQEAEQELDNRAAAKANRAQDVQDTYDDEYTKVAYAAPGYGSSLLPSDTSHGGTVRRNVRSGA